MPELTYRDRVACYFKAHPGQWIDGMALAQVGGCYAWRTRVSECHTQLGMDIENDVRQVPNSRRKVSLYRYRPTILEMAEMPKDPMESPEQAEVEADERFYEDRDDAEPDDDEDEDQPEENPREKGDDDGVEYGDPRDEQEERRRDW